MSTAFADATAALALAEGIPLGGHERDAWNYLIEVAHEGATWHEDSQEGERLVAMCVEVLRAVARRS